MAEEIIIPIYSGKPANFTWIGFGSGSGTNLEACARIIRPSMVFSDKPNASLFKRDNLSESLGIVHEKLNGFQYCGSWKKAMGNPGAEAEYKKRSIAFNQEIVRILREHEDWIGKGIDMIVLGGYMRFVEEPLLAAYPDRIINVHPALLSILDLDYNRIFVGEDAVHDAIKAGQKQTNSSVILVNEGVDDGEILTIGPKVEVWQEYLNGTPAEKKECLREYADSHQSFQKVRSDWPALTTALELIANGRLALGSEKSFHGKWRTVYLDGVALPYSGFEVKRTTE